MGKADPIHDYSCDSRLRADLVNGCEDFLRDLLTTSQIMITIGKDLRLDDRYDPGTLTDRRVTSENVSILDDGKFAGAILLDLKYASPFGELATVLLVLNATSLKIVETLGRAFVVSSKQRYDTLVDLYTRKDVALLQQLDERSTVVGLLIEGLVEKDHTGDMITDDILNKK